jgi:hypothetical protein
MALIDKTIRYDKLKAPFRGHALADLLTRRGGKYEFSGSFSFQTEAEYQQLEFRDTTASEEMAEIDPWTGRPGNLYTYEQVASEVPTWAEIEAEYADDLEEYAAYEGKRNRQYPDVKEQLDLLFKDIDAGKLGDTAKTSQFYVTIKGIKDSNP